MKFLLAPAFLLLSLFVQGQNNLVFIENKGQLVDTRGNLRPDILFYCDSKDGRFYFFKDGYSRVVSSKNKMGKKNVYTYFRSDNSFQSVKAGASVHGENPFPFYSRYYLANCPKGIQAAAYEMIVYKNPDGSEWVVNNKGEGIFGIEKRASFPQTASACNTWSTFYGGTGNDEAWSIITDAMGNSYTTGNTSGTDFPASPGCFQDTSKGSYDAFIIKMDSCGARKWATYVGSTADDFCERICMNGNAVVIAGYTDGTDFPVTVGADQVANAGSYDAFLFKADSSGARIWSTYYGGTGGELGLGVTSDLRGNIYLGGSTSSTNLPVNNAFQPTLGGQLDAFITKYTSSGLRRWSSYFGGSGSEDVHAMVTDASGDVVVVGGTYSLDLSTSTGAFQVVNNGIPDAYVAKFDSVGNRIFSTYCGGSGDEDGNAVCVDQQKNIYVAGHTDSPNFPSTPGAYQQALNANHDLYVMQFSPSGAVGWATYFGGTGTDDTYSMSTDNNGHLFVLANTNSTDIPVIGVPVQATNAGGQDLFVVKFDTYGAPAWSTYFGGSLTDIGTDISSGPGMRQYICGLTLSPDFPTTAGAFQPVISSPEDCIIMKMDGSYDITTGLKEIQQNDLKLFPVPASDVLHIEFTNNRFLTSLSILDVEGRNQPVSFALTPQTDSKIYSCDLSHLPAGIYFLRLDTGNETCFRKISVLR